MMKKGMKRVISALIATSCCTSIMALSACKPVEPSPQEPVACTQHVDEGGDGLCDICGEAMPSGKPDDEKPSDKPDDEKPGNKPDDEKPGNKPDDEKPGETKAEWTLSLEKTLDIDVEDEPQKLKYIVLKDGQAVDNADVDVKVTGDALTYDSATGKITPVKKGSATVTVTLNGTGGDAIVKSQTITVHNYFFSHTLYTDDVELTAIQDEANDPYVLFGKDKQSAVLVKKKSTKYVFKCKLYLASDSDAPKGEMFGVGSFLADSKADVNQKALWFGLRNPTSSGLNNPFAQASKNFYGGWNGSESPSTQAGYDELSISRTGDDELGIPFVLIRDGADYYYSIDGYYGKRTVNEHKDVATYAGVFSQKIALEINSFTYDDADDAVADAIAEYYTNRGIAAIKINESTTTELVKGQQQQYTAQAYPMDKAAGAELVWELDKSGLNVEAVENTTISADGMVTVADNASGNMKVICKTADGSVKSEIAVTVLNQSLDAENDFVRVKGGVQIASDTDNAITFPESYMHKNGISDSVQTETGTGDYIETKYCAVLKNNVTKDFKLSFKFGGYKTNISTPKLQISLGAENNNFYLVYSNDSRFHVEAWAKGTRNVNEIDPHKAGWYDSNVLNNFNPNDEHTCEISVNNVGLYTVKIDGNEMSFTTDGGANSAVLVRPYDAFTGSLPIKFAAQACSVSLTNIAVTNGTCELPTFYAENQNNQVLSDSAFTLKLDGPTWRYSNKTQYKDYKVYYTQPLGDQFALDLNAKFNKSVMDGKFIIGIGSSYVQCNITRGQMSICVVKQNDQGAFLFENGEKVDATVSALAEANKFKVRIERKDNKLRVIVNGKLITSTYSSSAGDNDLVFSYFYNDDVEDGGDPADLGTTISVTDFALSAWSVAPVYEFGMESSSLNIVAGGTATNTVVEHFDGVSGSDGLSYKYTLDSGDKEYYTIDAATGTVTAKPGAPNYSNVTVKVELIKNNETLYFTTYEVMCAPVSNDYVEVKGGVVLNIPNQSDINSNWSLEFPESHKNDDGVGNENKYEANGYSADLKTKVKGDFRIEFKVDEYGNGNGSKLMVSIGGYANQFYIVHGGNNRVETFTRGLGYDGRDNEKKLADRATWINSADIGAFNGPETYKIECIGGIYKIYRNGTLLNFYYNDDSQHEVIATMYRAYDDYYGELPIRISTKGVYAKVSNIVVTDLNNGGASTVQEPTLYSLGREVTSANSFTMTNEVAALTGDDWLWRTSEYYTVYYKDALDNDSVVEFDADFSKAMADGKLGIKLGNLDVHITNKGSLKSVFVPGGNTWGYEAKDIPVLNEKPFKVHIRIERKGGRVRVIANGALVDTIEGYNSGDLSFFFFTGGADSGENSVIVSNLQVQGEGFTSQIFYDIQATASTTTIKPGDTTGADITATVYEDAATRTQVTDLTANGLTVEYDISNKTDFTLTGNKVTANADLTGNKSTDVTITLKKNGTAVASKTVTISVATQNDTLLVKGGALLEYSGDDPNAAGWKVVFPENMMSANGVGNNEGEYADNAYGANLFATPKGDFSLEFTVSNYKKNTTYPKLMISLGGHHNQFYISYDRPDNPGKFWIESFTWGDRDGGSDSGWFNSDSFTDATVPHTIKIAVRNGLYEVYVDGNKVNFYEGGNTSNPVRTLQRIGYSSNLPIRFSTSGASCEVSNITLTETGKVSPFIHNDTNVTVKSENSFEMKFTRSGWDANYSPAGNKVSYSNGIAANTTIEFDLTANTNAVDSKVLIWIGDKRMCLNLNVNSSISCNINAGDNIDLWYAVSTSNAPVPTATASNPLHVTIVRSSSNNNNTMKVSFGKDDAKEQLSWNGTTERAADSSNRLEFAVFNGADDTTNVDPFVNDIVKISNLTVTNN